MSLRTCPECGKAAPPTHFYPKSGKPRCIPHLKWPLARRWKVMTMIEQGRSNAQIAKALGVSTASIILVRKRYKLEPATSKLLTASRLADMMGVGCAKTISHWIRTGFLKATHGYHQGPHRVWLINPLDVFDFLADEATWHLWQVDRIVDAELREYALKVRGDVRFLTPREAGWELYVEHKTINSRIRRGKMSARKWGNWWIDEREVERLKQEAA